MVELEVVDILSKVSNSRAYVLVLQEKGGLRRIIVALGTYEAQAVAFALRNDSVPRPMTHDLFGEFAKAFDIKLEYVHINKINDGTFHSLLCYRQGDERRSIDSRTSDAVAIALRARVPVCIDDELLNRMCIHDEHNGMISIPITAADEETLRAAMDAAVKKENYELAMKLKEEIDSRHVDQSGKNDKTEKNEE